MKACLMDWECECGVSATNVPLIGPMLPHHGAGWGVPVAAISHHELTHPCAMIQGKGRHAEAIRRGDHWYVTLKTPEPSQPNPKPRERGEC